MNDALLLSRLDLEATLDFPSTMEALSDAFQAEHRREWDTPKRIAAHTKAGGLLAMPCGGGAPEALGAKLVSTFPGNGALGLPSVSGLYALFDPKTGLPVAVMDGGYLTLVRTAAVSALATRRLSRRDARTLGILGAGAQAEFHARFIATVRPIDRVLVWARDGSRARALLAALQKDESLRQVTTWTVCSEPHDPSACDVVVTATAAAKPVLEGRWLSAGSHVNSIGAHTRSTREIDATAVSRAAVLAVETVGTLAEAGDFQMAHEELGGVLERVVTLSALLDPAAPPEPRESRDPSAITIFKSCGVAFEDLAVASLAFARAQAKGIGSRFRFA